MLDLVENNVVSKTVLLPAYICESVIIPFVKDILVIFMILIMISNQT